MDRGVKRARPNVGPALMDARFGWRRDRPNRAVSIELLDGCQAFLDQLVEFGLEARRQIG